MPTPNNALCPTVATVSGSGAKGKSVRHTARHGICSVTAWYMVSQPKSHSVGGFLNRRFEWRFWERSERRRWRIQRGERVAAVKISSARRKAAQKFWVPQQRLAAKGKSRSRRSAKHPCRRRQKRENPPALDIRRKTCYSFPVTGDDGRGGPEPREEMPAGRPVTGMRVWIFPNSGGTTDGYRSP